MDLKLSYVEFCASLLNPVMQQALLPIGPAEGACSGGKRMDGKLFTDSEQDWSSSSESDWMNEKGKRIRKQGVKRKKNQQNGNKKKIARSKNSNCPGVDLTDIFQEVRKKDQLDVHCGKMAGCLYRIKYDNGEKCISCKGRWFTPMRFEKFGGKGHYKKWKASIYYKPSNGLQQVNLLKLIQNGCLSEFGQQGKSIRKVTKTESHKILFSKIPKIPVCRIEDEIIQLDSSSDESVSVAERVKKNKRESVIFTEDLSKRITEPVESTTSAKDSSSDESVSVAKRVKMNRRESLILAKTVRKTITELDKSTASARDLHAPPTDATESAVSGQLRQSIREVTQTKSWERLFSKSLAIPVCRIDKETIQLGGAEPASDDSSESAAVFEEVEEMDGELFTDSEQDCGRASESDWKNETGKGKQAVKRKMNQQNRTKNKIAKGKYPRLPDLKKMNAESVMKQTKPESELKKNSSETGFNEDADRKRMKEKMKRQRCSKQSNNKRPFSSHVSNDTGVKLSDVFQEVRNKKQLAVRCGKIAGCLYRIKYDNGEKCILCKGKWFTPNQFEEFGGKGHHKKWKGSISYKPSNGLQQVKLWKLIQRSSTGLLLSGPKYFFRMKANFACHSEIKVPDPITSELKKKRPNGSPESSPVADRLIKRKCQRQLFPSCSESNGRNNNDNGGTVNETDEDIIDMTIFEGPTLPVTCDSGSGILHKYRFATGRCGRCIRTKDFWLTPEEFIQVSKPDGTWRKDILSNGVPLGKLIMKRVLELHMINCDCEICEELDQYLNDDVCFICDSGGDLVCCDECPRAFHPHCHLPAADGELSGSKWSCTFCLMKNMESSSQKTQQDVLSSPVSQYTLHCQYLLLQLLHESMTEPCANVSGYSENICGPMMLGRVKMNLENNDYKTVEEFVSDIELIFNNFCTSSRDNDSSRMTYRLKEVFNREFESIFIMFEAPVLSVTCSSSSGNLHKYRFASGQCGRCIRTENFWLTPEDFSRLSKPDAIWKKHIVSHGMPLGKLITKGFLEPHAVNCDCEICQEPDQNLKNDDVCFVCDSEGDLVCCDDCPRAFHSHCHIPAVNEDLPGSQWSCTFCVKNMRSSSQKTQQDVLSSPVSQYKLHCQYLLLQLLRESMTELCANVSGYSENICGPMMLGRVKMNLENDDYQTVREFIKDIEYVFHHCTANRDNDFSRMASRLKELLDKVF
ncbi:hypothetical protein Q8A67_000398 [Cirrhinus molitorella]|uniref:Nuclear body protein SP140-like protein n=1 Tax=Cirrhinus molitorella TaxID=172907 RepID=A0AA88QNI5_9TELE|nr:hypothetical protein Q8A67_000398 [Cirrhinus molitorella]